MRIQSIGLEHHRQPALGRRQLIGALAADAQLAAIDLLQARNHAQQGRLAAAGRTDEDNQLAVTDVEVEAVNNGLLAVKALDDIAQADCCHRSGLGRRARCSGVVLGGAHRDQLRQHRNRDGASEHPQEELLVAERCLDIAAEVFEEGEAELHDAGR